MSGGERLAWGILGLLAFLTLAVVIPALTLGALSLWGELISGGC